MPPYKNISADEFNDICKQYGIEKSYIKQWIKNPIYRGQGGSNPLLYFDSSMSDKRKSKNTYNFYTVVIDEDPRWKDFPKRSKSMICTTDRGMANMFGTVYYVIPLELDKNIGVCPDEDIWWSFQDFGRDADTFNRELIRCFLAHGHDWVLTPANNVNSLADLKDLFDKMEAYKEIFIKAAKDHEPGDDEAEAPEWYFIKNNVTIFRWINSNYTLYESYKKSIDPDDNGFKTVPVGEFQSYEALYKKEVWMDSKSLLIGVEPAKEFNKTGTNQ